MKIRVFLESAGNFEEQEILKKFHDGLYKFQNWDKYEGAANIDHLPWNEQYDVRYSLKNDYEDCDVAVIMGSWKPDRGSAHHQVRTAVVRKAPMFICIETPLLGRTMFQPNKMQRVGIDGFLNNQAQFVGQDHGSDRLNKLGIKWDGWKNNEQPDGHVLLMLQLPGDASLRGMDMYKWATWAVKRIREETDRKIIVRTHPGHNPKDADGVHKFIADIARTNTSNLEWSIGGRDGTTVQEDLKGAYCSVSYTSGSAIDSVLQGIPSLACDPGNFTFDISSRYMQEINSLKKAGTKEVMQWLYNLAYSQWDYDEFVNGKAWLHLRPMIVKEWNQRFIKRRK